MAAMFLSACTGLKYVPAEERLYTGAEVETIQTSDVKGKHEVKKAARELRKPKPNSRFLFSRPGLWFWYVTGDAKKGFKGWVKRKLGQPPVYMSDVDPGFVSRAMDARIFNMGFFTSYTQYQVNEGKNQKTASVTYSIFLNQPFLISDITYPSDSGRLEKAIASTAKESLLKKGDRYDLDKLVSERVRIDKYLKDNGFYYFNPGNLLFRADTLTNLHFVKVQLTVKEDIPDQARNVYKLSEVNVFTEYKPGQDPVLASTRKVIDSIAYYRASHYIRIKPIKRSLFVKPGQVYSRTNHNLTLSRLNGLGVFKFVNLRFSESDSLNKDKLKADIFLSPLPKKSLSLELQGVSKSNNFLGPGLTLSLRNRNAMRGAELIIYNLRGSFETQLNGQYKGQFTYEINPRVELYVPRFLSPIKLRANKMYVPRTKFIVDYSYLKRVGYFNLNSVKFNFGYKWKETLSKDHDLSLININYFKIYNPSDNFTEMISRNNILRRRFEEQFIAGTAYSFFYNEQVKPEKKNQIYFNGNAELAGNTLSFMKKIFAGVSPDPENGSTILGIRYAQYARFDIDFRNYYHLTPNTMLAGRFIAGIGIPYGNSSTMPYIKQFFSGGAYSVRGFRAFSVGPGSFMPADSVKQIFFLQQGGEIKLEANLEYRFGITKFLKGAFFTDAGNTWLNGPNSEIPGGEFRSDRFMRELAVGVGTGLRVDLSVFVIRFDLGIPIRKPWLPDGERWVVDKIDFSDGKWRGENLVFNIAFGYPF